MTSGWKAGRDHTVALVAAVAATHRAFSSRLKSSNRAGSSSAAMCSNCFIRAVIRSLTMSTACCLLQSRKCWTTRPVGLPRTGSAVPGSPAPLFIQARRPGHIEVRQFKRLHDVRVLPATKVTSPARNGHRRPTYPMARRGNWIRGDHEFIPRRGASAHATRSRAWGGRSRPRRHGDPQASGRSSCRC